MSVIPFLFLERFGATEQQSRAWNCPLCFPSRAKLLTLIENMFAKLNGWRRVATRYDGCAQTLMSAIHIAASFIFYFKE